MKPKFSYQGGQAMMIAVMFFLVVSLTIIFGLATPIVKQQAATSNLYSSRKSYFLAEGGVEDVVYRLKTGRTVDPTEVVSLDGGEVTIETSDIEDGKQVIATADLQDLVRKLETNIVLGSGASFFFGIHAGPGGLIMENSSSIDGNVFASGFVTGSGILNNTIRGTVVSGGPTGKVEGVYATSSVWAHTINNAKVGGDAYYQTISNTTVIGAQHPASDDQATSTLPITDEKIEDWKSVATTGPTVSSPCPYKITAATTTGPLVINCDLEISGNNYTITLTGNIWVKGNITIKNSPNFKVDSSFGSKGVVIIADNPANQDTSSRISIENSTTFEGSGTKGSHVLFISQNHSAENGGSTSAIDVKNSVSGALLVYSGHGEITVQNSVNLKEVTGYRIRLQNTANVKYETGIANVLFESGPSGGYQILKWQEVE